MRSRWSIGHLPALGSAICRCTGHVQTVSSLYRHELHLADRTIAGGRLDHVRVHRTGHRYGRDARRGPGRTTLRREERQEASGPARRQNGDEQPGDRRKNVARMHQVLLLCRCPRPPRERRRDSTDVSPLQVMYQLSCRSPRHLPLASGSLVLVGQGRRRLSRKPDDGVYPSAFPGSLA